MIGGNFDWFFFHTTNMSTEQQLKEEKELEMFKFREYKKVKKIKKLKLFLLVRKLIL